MSKTISKIEINYYSSEKINFANIKKEQHLNYFFFSKLFCNEFFNSNFTPF